MFENFIRVLKKGKEETVLLTMLWRDIEQLYEDENVLDTPESKPNIDWIKTTEWYKDGGYEELRLATYPPIGDQLDMLYKKDWEGWRSAITEIKEKWPKP